MPTDADPPQGFQPTYRTGAAARLAGIPVETLRVWERRYRVVDATRAGERGHRLYSAEDVSRLALMKQLVDLGNPIGTIAALPLAALREMRAAADAASRGLSTRPLRSLSATRVALVGGAIARQNLASNAGLRSTMDIVATSKVTDDANALRGVSADIVVIELPLLHAESADVVARHVEATGARHAIVAYRFGTSFAVRALRDRGYTVTRLPLDAEMLQTLCRAAVEAPANAIERAPPALPIGAIPPRRFDDPSLSTLARISTTLHCECPQHVVDLLQGLCAFEDYSRECTNRSPEDAELHRYLQRVAGSARVLFEDALERIARAEGLLVAGESATEAAAR